MQPTATLPQSQPDCLNDSSNPPTGLIDCGNWAVSASWTVPSNAVSGLYWPTWSAMTQARTQTTAASYRSSSATTPATPTSCSKPMTRPGRPTTPTAATACTNARSTARPAAPKRYKGAAKVSYNRPWHSARMTYRGQQWRELVHVRRVPDDPVPGGERVRRQLHQRRRRFAARLRIGDRAAQGLPDRRPRRVLVRAAARQRHRRARRWGQSGVFQRERDVLEDPVGTEHRRVRTRRTGRW